MTTRGLITFEQSMPEPFAHDREKLNTDVMGMPGDPISDMAKSLRNIEWALIMIHNLLHQEFSGRDNEVADEPATDSKRNPGRRAQPAVSGD